MNLDDTYFNDMFVIPDGMDQALDIKTWLDVRLTALQDPEEDYMSTYDEEDTRPILF